jgi:hypothetical protein
MVVESLVFYLWVPLQNISPINIINGYGFLMDIFFCKTVKDHNKKNNIKNNIILTILSFNKTMSINIYQMVVNFLQLMGKNLKRFFFGCCYVVSYTYDPQEDHHGEHKDFIDDVFNNDYQKTYGNILEFRRKFNDSSLKNTRLTNDFIYPQRNYDVLGSIKEHFLYIFLITLFLMATLAFLYLFSPYKSL